MTYAAASVAAIKDGFEFAFHVFFLILAVAWGMSVAFSPAIILYLWMEVHPTIAIVGSVVYAGPIAYFFVHKVRQRAADPQEGEGP